MKILAKTDTVRQRLDCFWRFVEERERIRVKKESGQPRPWTDDMLLNTYHFCNVRRRDDRVTIWIGEWVNTNVIPKDYWFWYAVARWINEPDTLQQIPVLAQWDARIIKNRLRKIDEQGKTIFRGSYIITGAFSNKGQRKYESVVDKVLTPLWKKPPMENSSDLSYISCESAWKILCEYTGFGSFMAGQVVADWETFGVIGADDKYDWASLGPGSKRGIRWIFQPTELIRQDNGVEWMRECRRHLMIRDKSLCDTLTLHDVQNCLCEFSKYTRGYAKTKYEPYQEKLL